MKINIRSFEGEPLHKLTTVHKKARSSKFQNRKKIHSFKNKIIAQEFQIANLHLLFQSINQKVSSRLVYVIHDPQNLLTSVQKKITQIFADYVKNYTTLTVHKKIILNTI